MNGSSILIETRERTMSQRATGLSRPSSSNRRLRDLMLQRENRVCADCGAPDPKWASANIGVFICLKCSGVHRSLGTHISKVLSVTLDEWSDNEIDAMIEVGGNASANSIYEAYIPEGVSKPGPDASHDNRAKFIRSKYELQDFLKPSLRILSAPKNHSLQSSFSSSRKSMESSFRSSSSVDNSGGMVEFIGMLKVKVIKGTNLAIRDMLTSDPYVVLTLGKQTVRTNVIKSNLNPVWNEELMLSVPQHHGALKLVIHFFSPSTLLSCILASSFTSTITFCVTFTLQIHTSLCLPVDASTACTIVNENESEDGEIHYPLKFMQCFLSDLNFQLLHFLI
nr:ADP-ribosylation factor GTPase-activating protein AGD12-like [Ipomoea batatas]